MSALDIDTRAELNAETAAVILEAAQLIKGTDPDAQTMGAIGAGYAILAAADRMAVLVESLETLAATVDGLTAAVDAMATPRRRWWHRFTRVTVHAAESEAETPKAPAAQQHPDQTAETADDDQGAAGVLFVGPWVGVQS